MNKGLLQDIEAFIRAHELPEYSFGWLAIGNGRLVERLRIGGRVWPDTEERIRRFMVDPEYREQRRREMNALAAKRRKSAEVA